MKRETVAQRRQRGLREIVDLATKSESVKQMVRIVCIEEGATSAHHLLDINPKAFDLLHQGAVSLVDQLGADDQ